MKRLIIGLDPGFDGGKIVINKMTLSIPFAVEDITNELSKYPLSNRNAENFIRLEKDGSTYLVGDFARLSLLEADHQKSSKDSLDTFYTISRFSSKLFEVGLNTMLGYALYKYEEYTRKNDVEEVFNISEIDEWDIHVGVALPHEFMDDLWAKHVKDYLAKPQNYNLLVGTKTIKFNYQLKEENCVYNSQAICALIDLITDDEGNNIDSEKDIQHYLPALIIDGGYKTLGKFKLSRDGRMDKDESNTDFAMNNINEAVAAEIRKKNANIYGYMIEEKYNANEEIYYEDEDGTVKSFDVRAMRDAETVKTANRLMEYLMTEHNRLLDIKLILVAGGTGAAYYNTIKEFCDKRDNLKGKVKLANNGFDGKECEPVYAIVIGLYKAMVARLQ